MNSNCSNLSYLRNLQEQVKKAFCYQKLFWPFTVWINCSSDLNFFENSRPSASNFSRSLEQFFLTVGGQNNFGNKIPKFLIKILPKWSRCDERLYAHYSILSVSFQLTSQQTSKLFQYLLTYLWTSNPLVFNKVVE